MSLYGLPPAELGSARDHLLAVEAAFARAGQPSLMCDNLVTLSRIHSFAHDQAFVAALHAAARSEADYDKVWKIYTYCWACRSALALDGDFIECGVFEGLYAATMARYLDWGNAPKTLYLTTPSPASIPPIRRRASVASIRIMHARPSGTARWSRASPATPTSA